MSGERPPAQGQGRVFHRSPGTRLITGGCSLLFTAGAAWVGAISGITPGFFVVAGLALLSLASAAGAWGDRYTLGPAGIEYRNGLVATLGGRPRLVPWSEVLEVREHRSLRLGRMEPQPSAVFLILRSGRRIVLDSLNDFDAVLETIRRYRNVPAGAR